VQITFLCYIWIRVKIAWKWKGGSPSNWVDWQCRINNTTAPLIWVKIGR
jgi:hypothetical protein